MRTSLYSWQASFVRNGLTSTLLDELSDLLKPLIRLSASVQYQNSITSNPPTENTRIDELVRWEVVLSTNEAHFVLKDIAQRKAWREALPSVLPIAVRRLNETLDLMRELGAADDLHDGVYYQQPSIGLHPQNSDFRDWTVLIDLTRDSWQALAETMPRAATFEVERWLSIPYPTFKRLAFYAATVTDLFSPDAAAEWLLRDDHYWLWTIETERESMRLLAKLAKALNSQGQDRLLQAILNGPPPSLYRDEIEAERLTRLIDHEIWLRLAKWRDAGGVLNLEAEKQFVLLTLRYPDWHLAADQSDEFPVWMGDVSGTGDEWRALDKTPVQRRDLAIWLLKSPPDFKDNDWRERCRNDFARCAAALIQVSTQDRWPIEPWRTALQTWSEEAFAKRSWKHLHSVLASSPQQFLEELSSSFSWWLEAAGRVLTSGEADFFGLINRVLKGQLPDASDSEDNTLSRSINHPVGHVTDAIFKWWYRQGLNDGQGLHDEVRKFFSLLCGSDRAQYRYGRVLLSVNIIALFRVDPDWTSSKILPFFRWKEKSSEALSCWRGFLWSPRLHIPLLTFFKEDFLACAKHYDELGEVGRNFAALLAYASLDARSSFSKRELASATAALPTSGLASTVQVLIQALDAAGAQRAEYWRNRISSYLNDIWPKSKELRTTAVTTKLARLCVKSGEAFPEAVEELKHWLQPVNATDLFHEFLNSRLAEAYPTSALTFLDIIADENSFWSGKELKEILRTILHAQPNLEDDSRLKRLEVFVRQFP